MRSRLLTERRHPLLCWRPNTAEERLRSDPGSHHEVGAQAYERDPRMLIGRELYAESM